MTIEIRDASLEAESASDSKPPAPAASRKCCSACSKSSHSCHPERSDCFANAKQPRSRRTPYPRAVPRTSRGISIAAPTALKNSLRRHRQFHRARDPSAALSLASRPPTPLRMTGPGAPSLPPIYSLDLRKLRSGKGGIPRSHPY